MVRIREVTEGLDHTMHAIVIEYLLAVPGSNDMIVGPITEFADQVLSAWIADPIIMEAVRAHNLVTADLPIDTLIRDDASWVAEVALGTGPMIEKIAASPASGRLITLQAGTSDIVTEVFIMDLRGVNVAESEPTSQYWHIEEDRFDQIANFRDMEIYISDVHLEQDGSVYQAQVSLPIKDPETLDLIGVATFGVNVQSMF
jgi:hypothetical protein